MIEALNSLLPFGPGIQDMLEKAQSVERLADTLEHLGAPHGLPEDWIIVCDNDGLRHMQRHSAKRLLVQAKKETAHRWLRQRFDPTEMDLELSQECEDDNFAEEFDERRSKQHALNSIDEVISTVNSLREAYASILCEEIMLEVNEETVVARVAFGYPKEAPSRSDCFDEDIRRQCQRVIREIYKRYENSSGSVVYLISVADPKFVKIGFSANFEQRLRSLRTASHVEPTVHLVVPGTRLLERNLHERFAPSRHNREWFHVTKEVQAFISSERSKLQVENRA